jgi:hypothetical protein
MSTEITMPSKGGGTTVTKLIGQTLTASSWVLTSGLYSYSFANVAITATSVVDFTPDNTSYFEVTSCGMLPEVDVASGTCTFYSLFPPQSNITGEIVITQTA